MDRKDTEQDREKRRSTGNYTKGHERDNRGSFQRKSVQRRRCNKELNRILDDSMQEIKDTNPELNDDMLAMMKQQLKEELVDVQDVLNSYASNLYDNMNDTSTVQGKVAKLYTILLSMPCRVAAGAAILILAVLTILLAIQDTEVSFHLV